PADNCGTTYFAIQFQGVNEKGFGDYADGFVPGGAGGAGTHGCVVADDFSHQLGDPNEARLKAALAYRANGSCGTVASRSALVSADGARDDVTMVRNPFIENRIMWSPRK